MNIKEKWGLALMFGAIYWTINFSEYPLFILIIHCSLAFFGTLLFILS